MTDYRQPLGLDILSTPPVRDIDWVNGTDESGAPVKAEWWVASVWPWGGRKADVVIASAGEMYAFDRHGTYVGGAETDLHPEPGTGSFYPLAEADVEAPTFHLAYFLRNTGLMVADVNGVVGLTLQEGAVQGTHCEWMWRVAYGFVLLGYFPPVPGPIHPEEWELGVGEIGEQAARRVKRAILTHSRLQGRALRKRATELTTLWN